MAHARQRAAAMTEFLAGSLAYPTVVFTVLLVAVLIYWLMVVLGFLDHGHVDGSPDLDIDAAAHAVGHGHDVAELGHGHHGESGGVDDGGGIAGMLASIGLGGVPVTVSGSLVTLGSWTLTHAAMGVVRPFMPGGLPGLAAGTAVACVAMVAAVLATTVVVRPIRPLFRLHPAPERRAMVGRLCTIRTQRVDERFGQAVIEDGGAGLLAEVRCTTENHLSRGERAIVFDYDPKHEVYFVAPVDRELAELSD